MSSDLAKKGKRILVSLLSSLYEYGQMPKHVFFKLFDMKVVPILLYGSEIWGYRKYEVFRASSVLCMQKIYVCCHSVGIKSCKAWHPGLRCGAPHQ